MNEMIAEYGRERAPNQKMTAPENYRAKKVSSCAAHCARRKTGANWAQLRLILTPMSDHPAQPTLGQHGGKRTKGQQGDNVTLLRSRGNSVAYLVARLRREGRFDLVEAVYKGHTSAFACAVRLGWRQRPVYVSNSNQARPRIDPRAMIG